MKLLVLFFALIGLSWAEEALDGAKRTTKRGISGYGYASDYGYGHYTPLIAAPVVTKVSYGYKPYGGYYGHGFGHGSYGHGYGLGHGYGYGHGYYYPYYGYGHGHYDLGHSYYGLGHGYYGHGFHDWW